MNRLAILTLAIAAIATFTSLAGADTRWSDHAGRRARIRDGAVRGQLTPREAARLRAGQLQIRRLERMAWADGRLTRRERAMLQRAKLQHSRAIFRLRHNGRMV